MNRLASRPIGSLLLPRGCRFIGSILILTGLALAWMRFGLGIKPALFNWHVPALYAEYLESTSFSLVTNHFSEELAGMLVLLGLVMLALTKELRETPGIMAIRGRAFLMTVYLQALLLLLAFLLLYGLGFVTFLILNCYLPFVTYLLVFQVLKTRTAPSPREVEWG